MVQLMSPRVRRLIAFHRALSFSAFQTNDGGSTNPTGRGTGILTNTRYSGSSIFKFPPQRRNVITKGV